MREAWQPYMTKPIPLCSALCVQIVLVIKDYTWNQGLYFMVETFASKCRLLGNVQWEAKSKKY